MVLYAAADIDGPLHAASILDPQQRPASAARRATVQEMAESAVVLLRIADDASGSIHYSLELVCGRLGCPSENGIAVVHE